MYQRIKRDKSYSVMVDTLVEKVNPFDAVIKQLDIVGKKLKLNPSFIEYLKHPRRIIGSGVQRGLDYGLTVVALKHTMPREKQGRDQRKGRENIERGAG